jgi:hypothetical protein
VFYGASTVLLSFTTLHTSPSLVSSPTSFAHSETTRNTRRDDGQHTNTEEDGRRGLAG